MAVQVRPSRAAHARASDEPAAGRWRAAALEHRWSLAVAGFVALLGIVLLAAGPPRIAAPWDNFALLDGGWRIQHGQVPGIDYSNPIGPLVYAAVALGMRLQHTASFASITYATVIALAVFAPLCWLVVRRRLPGWSAALLTGSLSLAVVAEHPLGFRPWVTTYALLYNRWGWALYAVLLCALFVPRLPSRPEVGGHRRALGWGLDGSAVGVLTGLLFQCKITFFGAVVVGLGVAWWAGTLPRARRWWVGLAGGFGASLLAAWAVIGVEPLPYLRDFLTAGDAQSTSARVTHLAHVVAYDSPYLLVFGVAVAVLVRVTAPGLSRRAAVRLAVVLGWGLLSSLVLSAGDAADGIDLPAWFALAVIAIESVRRLAADPAAGGVRAEQHRTAGAPRWETVAVAGLVLAAFVPTVAQDLASVGLTVAHSGSTAEPGQRFDSRHLSDFVIPRSSDYATAYRFAHDTPAFINSGIHMLDAHVPARARVLTLAFTDPFSFATGRVPLTGVPAWWDQGFDFDAAHHPPTSMLASTDWVMVPRLVAGQGCCQATVVTMQHIYGGYLAAHFHQVASDGQWQLLERGR